MHPFTRTFAIARRDKDIVISLLFTEAEFTTTLSWIVNNISAIELLEENIFSLALELGATSFDDAELNSPQFDDVPAFWMNL